MSKPRDNRQKDLLQLPLDHRRGEIYFGTFEEIPVGVDSCDARTKILDHDIYLIGHLQD